MEKGSHRDLGFCRQTQTGHERSLPCLDYYGPASSRISGSATTPRGRSRSTSAASRNLRSTSDVLPSKLGEGHIREYQRYLVEEKKSSWAFFNQSLCALRFFYGTTLHKDWSVTHIPFPRTEKRLPEVLSIEEVSELLGSVRTVKARTILETMYGSGLRLTEDVPEKRAKRSIMSTATGVVLALTLKFVGVGTQPKEQAPPLESGEDMLDCLLPPGEVWKPGDEWVLTARVVPASESEWRLTIVRESAGNIRLELSWPKGFRIWSEFYRLSGSDSAPTCDQLRQDLAARHLEIGHCETDVEATPALRAPVELLDNQRWPAAPDSGIILHPTEYDVSVQSVAESVRLVTQGPEDLASLEGTGWHPIITWIEGIKALLSTCKE